VIGGAAGGGDFHALAVSSFSLGGDIRGGGQEFSGYAEYGTTGDSTIGGSIIGGTAPGTGFINGGGRNFRIGGNVEGGTGGTGSAFNGAGFVFGGSSKSFSLSGSIIGGSGVAMDGSVSLGDTPTVFIGGNIIGNATPTDAGQGGLILGKPVTVTIEGSISSSGSSASGTVQMTSAKSLTVLGSVTGGSSPNPHGDIAASVSLGALAIDGSVSGANIFIGGTASTSGSTVSNWTASSLAVGTINLGTGDAVGGTGSAADNVNFGDSHDRFAAVSQNVVVPAIASIVIGGAIDGTGVDGEHFGFVAGHIGAFTAGAVKLALQNGPGNDSQTLGATGDVTVKELPLPG
jgi:hypothetical protein